MNKQISQLTKQNTVKVQQKNTQEGRLKAARLIPPQSDGIYKLNVAFSQSKQSSSVGIRLIIRNNVLLVIKV